MSKTQKVLGKLRCKIQQAEGAKAAAAKLPGELKACRTLNDTLNATVIEQNERMETLAQNCTHYRQRLADLTEQHDDALADIDAMRGSHAELRGALKDARLAHTETAHQLTSTLELAEFRGKVNTTLRLHNEELRRTMKYDRLCTIGASALILGWVLYSQPVFGQLFRSLVQ